MGIFSRCVFYLDPNARITKLSPADEAKSQDFADASTHELAQNLTDYGGTVITGTGALPVARLRGCGACAPMCAGGASMQPPLRAALCSRRRLVSVESIVHSVWCVR